MIDLVLVDTNVILDVADEDSSWFGWSHEQMKRAALSLVINPLIYTELCYHAGELREVEATVQSLGLIYQDLPREALFMTARAFRQYHQKGGTKTAPLPDFFIGAHALVLGIPILTRDVNRYSTYFPEVLLISP
jgi:predicted nucleic acid-binding protein